jgi:DNA-binding MarR family transcriptional regulator
LTLTEPNTSENPLDSRKVAEFDFALWILLDHAHSAFSRARELELTQFGLTPEQGGVLHTLLEKGGSTTNAEIADIMIRQYNSTTTLITRMEKLGLVKKEKRANEKRFVVSITSKGQSIYEKVTANSIHMAFSDFTPADKQKLSQYLQQITDKNRRMLGIGQKLPFLS